MCTLPLSSQNHDESVLICHVLSYGGGGGKSICYSNLTLRTADNSHKDSLRDAQNDRDAE